ncbi:MAG TPA: GIY-YIG nuclease family protein [Desulfatiglandales bacterium]|nr:GIY-YIG nuclease family protein [Desulfatiglandales bacterium]
MNDYYVYVYIDPRNYEEFYYGKGKGSRKDAHLSDTSDTAKVKRISEIKREGLVPIIRVIARDLSENEALLIEKTLLWKLGKWTTNISPGHFSEKFRPHNTLHKELSGFDYRNGIYYYNVGEGQHRDWDDYVEFGFISAGQGIRWRDAMLGFNPGDVFAAYLKRHGFVGIGRIKTSAQMVRDVRIGNKSILDLKLRCGNMNDNCNSSDLSEYVCLVEWFKTVPREKAKWRSSPKLYTTTHVRASLDGQPETISFLENEFGVEIRKIIA